MRLIIACVRTGTAYPIEHVEKLRNMVSRHLMVEHEIVCLTDQEDRCDDVVFIDIGVLGLPGWWGKMALFEPSWRLVAKVLYFDLDTVIINRLETIALIPGEFAILESPVRASGKEYPCRYNSSTMVLGPMLGDFMWRRFEDNKPGLMRKHDRFGDQACIEELYPDALLLNRQLPGCFLNYRYLTGHKPSASVINFGGVMKPAACDIPWVREAWQ